MPFSRRHRSSSTLPTPSEYLDQRNDHPVRESVSLTFSKHHLRSEHQDGPVEAGPELESVMATWKTSPGRTASSNHHRSGSQPYSTSMVDHRVSAIHSPLDTNISPRPSTASLTHKRSAGLRATFKRVFTNKRRRPPIEGVLPQDIDYRDPGNLIGNPRSSVEKEHPKEGYRRSQSLTRPVTRSSALRSHAPDSPFKDATNSSPEQPYSAKRRNTLPSLVLSDQEAHSFARSLAAHMNQIEGTPPLPLEASLMDKRRSRSLEAILKNQSSPSTKIQRQDREAAIAYWRKSVLDDPLPFTQDATSHIDEIETPVDSPHLSRHPPHSLKPTQSFDFGLNVEDGNAALEDRVNTLEVKMFDFEYAIAKLQGNELAKPTLQPRVSRSKSSHDLIHDSNRHSASSEFSARRMASFSRPRPSHLLVVQSPEGTLSDLDSRSDTIRPRTTNRVSTHSPHSPSLASVHITRGEYDSLMTLINDEKAARQQMEMQLMNLQKEIEQLRSPIYAAIHDPTPLNETRQDPPRTKTLHRTSPFDLRRGSPHSRKSSHRSQETTTDFQSDDYQETYETPRERYLFEMNRTSPLHGVAVI